MHTYTYVYHDLAFWGMIVFRVYHPSRRGLLDPPFCFARRRMATHVVNAREASIFGNASTASPHKATSTDPCGGVTAAPRAAAAQQNPANLGNPSAVGFGCPPGAARRPERPGVRKFRTRADTKDANLATRSTTRRPPPRVMRSGKGGNHFVGASGWTTSIEVCRPGKTLFHMPPKPQMEIWEHGLAIITRFRRRHTKAAGGDMPWPTPRSTDAHAPPLVFTIGLSPSQAVPLGEMQKKPAGADPRTLPTPTTSWPTPPTTCTSTAGRARTS